MEEVAFPTLLDDDRSHLAPANTPLPRTRSTICEVLAMGLSQAIPWTTMALTALVVGVGLLTAGGAAS